MVINSFFGLKRSTVLSSKDGILSHHSYRKSGENLSSFIKQTSVLFLLVAISIFVYSCDLQEVSSLSENARQIGQDSKAKLETSGVYAVATSSNFSSCSFPYAGINKTWASATNLNLPIDRNSDKKYYWRGLNNLYTTAGVLSTRYQVKIVNKSNYPATVRVMAVRKNILQQESYTVYSYCVDINSIGASKSYDFYGENGVYAYDFEIIVINSNSQPYPNNGRTNLTIDISLCKSYGGGCY